MPTKALAVSIVIPVFNEEHHIKDCLDSIALQSVVPDEVVVVDNNCTDQTIPIAKSYSFVRVVKEKQQGRAAATRKGMNSAKSEIICRIDADTRLLPYWTQQLQGVFADETVAAVSGPAFPVMSWHPKWHHSRLWSTGYFWLTELEFGIPIVWGSNMAMRKTAWQAIEPEVCLDDTLVHDDQDLSFLLAGHSQRTVRSNQLLTKVSGNSFSSIPKFWEYTVRRERTKKYHIGRGTLNNTSTRLGSWQRVGRGLTVLFWLPVFLVFCIPIGIIDVILAKLLRRF